MPYSDLNIESDTLFENGSDFIIYLAKDQCNHSISPQTFLSGVSLAEPSKGF